MEIFRKKLYNIVGGVIMDKLVLDVKELKEQLGISKASAYEITRSEGFPCFKVGKRILIPVEEFKKWLSQQALTHQNLPSA